MIVPVLGLSLQQIYDKSVFNVLVALVLPDLPL
jgi:hypothetical protein